MSAAGTTPLVQVPITALDASWIGEQLLVTHSRSDVCSRTWGKGLPLRRNASCTHFGGLADLYPLAHSAVLYIGGEQVLVIPGDVIVAAPTPTALDVEPDVAASPYDA